MARHSDLLPQVVARRANDAGNAVFVQDVGAGSASAAEVHDQALRWADGLVASGVRADEPVATMVPASGAAVALWLGISWAGAFEVPVNPAYFGRLLSDTLNRIQARILVLDRRWLPPMLDAVADVPGLELLIVTGPPAPAAVPVPLSRPVAIVEADELLATAEARDRPAPTSNQLACGLLTSGTTGPSKCVLIPWGQIRQMYVQALARPWTENEATYTHSPMYHLVARGLIYQAALMPGGRAVIRERYKTDRWWADVRDYGCTESHVTGVVAAWLWNQPPRPDDIDNPLRRLQMVPFIPQAAQFQERFGVRLFTAYGSTEIGAPIVADGVRDDSRSCGRPVRGAQLRLVDPLDGADVADGEVGELLVRGEPDEINHGYLNDPEANARSWAGGWFHTGDAFTRDDEGRYYFVDRFQDVIRRRGEKISSAEIESSAERHPAVALAAAVAVPADTIEDEIKLFVELAPGASLSIAQLQTYLESVLPRFMVPAFYEVVTELPRTATGKVRKAELRQAHRPFQTGSRFSANARGPS